MLAVAGCNGQQPPAAGGTPSAGTQSTAVLTPAPVPAPSNPAGRPATISGDYTLYRHQEACANDSRGCHANPMKIRIACAGNACTVIRANHQFDWPCRLWMSTCRLWIDDPAKAAREGVTLGIDMAALTAALKGHVKGCRAHP